MQTISFVMGAAAGPRRCGGRRHPPADGQAEQGDSRTGKELIESMNTRPFWHYCEACGKREFITAQDAFDRGWDYPPRIGDFGLLGSRTCGSCGVTDTLYWKINSQERAGKPA